MTEDEYEVPEREVIIEELYLNLPLHEDQELDDYIDFELSSCLGG